MARLPAILNNLSLVPLRVQSRFGDGVIATATGFLYVSEGRSYFVTNWHVVTGRHADTGEPLDKNCALPDSLSISLPFRRQESERPPVERIWWGEAKVPLYQDDERRVPRWL